jgi:Zn-dependent protease
MEHLLTQISIMLVPALLAITAHELAHGLVADKLGDPTARLLGRLTLNPLRHLDPIGTLAVLFFGFGWARPVPVNTNNLRTPRTDMIWVSLAGPMANLMLALASAILLRGFNLLGGLFVESAEVVSVVLVPLQMMVAFSLLINVILGVFNLLPLPPLDGGKVLTGMLPERFATILIRLEPFGLLLIIFLVFFTPLWKIISPIIMYLLSLMAGESMVQVEAVRALLLGG